jgi:CheY-like chemotaxis protein
MANIAVIDDSEDFLYLAKSILTMQGHHVSTVDSPLSWLSKTEEFSDYDLIIVDLLMNELNGLDLINKIRDLLGKATPKFCLVSVKKIEVEDIEKDLAFIQKPIFAREFIKRIKEILEK